MLWLKPINVSKIGWDENQVYLVSAGGNIFTSTAKRHFGVIIVDDVARKTTFTGMEIEEVAEIHRSTN